MLTIPWLQKALEGQPKDPRKLWETGFGAANGNNLLSMQLPQVGGVLIANIPQTLFSYMYLAFNALYTNMFVAHEWSTYLNERRPLRVTCPAGQQRYTYWLNIPFRYAIPLTMASSGLHWLASQSIFMVRITMTATEGDKRVGSGHISTCGYSPVAVILTIVVSCLIAIYGLALGQRKYPAGIPLASSCSAAISAACHPPAEDVDASLRPVQWGAVTHGERRGNGEDLIGHCSFSSLPVEPPIPGRLYA